jgi:hypothetical protein
MNLDMQAIIPQSNEIFRHSFENLWTTVNISVIRVQIRDQNINWNISSMTYASASTTFLFSIFQKIKYAYVPAECQVMAQIPLCCDV